MTKFATGRRWRPRALAVLIILLAALLAGWVFPTEKTTQLLVVDLRGTFDRNNVDRQLQDYRTFAGTVMLLVSPSAQPPCSEVPPTPGRKFEDDSGPVRTYCPLAEAHHMLITPVGPLANGDIGTVVAPMSMTVLRKSDVVWLVGRTETGFGWVPALLTSIVLSVLVLAGWNLALDSGLLRGRQQALAVRPVARESVPSGQPVTRPNTYGRVAPTPLPSRPQRGPDARAGMASAPQLVQLDTGASSVLSEIPQLVRAAGGTGLVRSHIEAKGGYVAFGAAVVWAASTETGVLPGDRVHVEYTGDPDSPLMITPYSSGSSREQDYPR